MCRIMFLKWKNKKLALEYLDAFYNAWCNDPYLENVAKLLNVPWIKNQHIHWWGYLLVSSDSIDLYRNWKFFYEDKKWFDNLKYKLKNINWEFLLMTELRITDIWYVSAFTAHPFPILTKNAYDGWLFFNGLLDYEKLAKLENIDYSSYSKKNGTIIMSLSIWNELEKWKSFKEAIKSPKKALKSWYNLMSFLHWPNGYKAYVNSYVKEELLEHKIAYDYYKLLYKEYWDLFFVGSSAIWVYKKEDYNIMKNWELFEFDIKWINEFYFNTYN